MTPAQIRAEFSEAIYTAPHADRLSQNDVAAILAHCWPAIAEYHARAVHQLKTPAPSGSEHYQAGWDTAIEAAADTIRNGS